MAASSRNIWSDDPDVIEERLISLSQEKVPIILAQKGCEGQAVYLQKIHREGSFTTLLFRKTKKVSYGKETCFFLYRLAEHPPQIFKGVPLLDKEDSLAITKPAVIFERSRRKYPRISTSAKSEALYLVPFSSRLCKGQPKDISREGLCMLASYSAFLKRGLRVGPIELILHCHSAAIEPIKIHIPEATVVRVVRMENNRAEIALNFKLDRKNANNVESYLELREMELQSAADRKRKSGT